MKRILAPILLLVFLFPSLALGEEVAKDDLVYREGLYYKKFTDVPFTGEITGQMLQGQFKKGKEEGPRVWYSAKVTTKTEREKVPGSLTTTMVS